MSEQPRFQSTESIEAEHLLAQQEAFRSVAESRIQHTPLPEAEARLKLEDYGLEQDAYDVYVDSEREFGGGFVKFASKEDDSETLLGVGIAYHSGPMHDPNRNMDRLALRANGEIVGILQTESSRGTETMPIDVSPESTDPKQAVIYKAQLRAMNYYAERLTAKPDESEPLRPALRAEAVRHSKLEKIRNWLAGR